MKEPRNQPISKYQLGKIMWHFCVDVTASQTALLTGINRNTVNRHYTLFRLAIYAHRLKQFQHVVGDVEMDESYFGASRVRGCPGQLKRGRGTRKQPVFGLFLRQGQVYTEIVPDCKKATLQAIIRKKIDPSSVIYTDGWRGYDGLVDVGYDKHFRVQHAEREFVQGGDVHINGIESFWSFTKRRLKKFNGVKVNFELHLKECEWRWQQEPDGLLHELKILYHRYLRR
jgi:transposase-like protein